MRTISGITGIPKDPDSSKFPDSTIVNETATTDGTPVVREIYGDVLTNIYKILHLAGVTANQLEDSETSGHQFAEALRKLPNLLNDIEQPMSLSSTVWSVSINLTPLPDKYLLFVTPVADYNPALNYTFKGSGATPSYNLSSAGFNAGDTVMLVLDHTGVRAFSLNAATAASQVFTPFGTPLTFNDSAKVWYQDAGLLYSDQPEQYDIQGAVRTSAGDGTILVYDMLILGGYLVCLCFSVATTTYSVYRSAMSAPATVAAVLLSGHTFPTGVDKQPHLYCDGTKIYISNGTGNSNNDYLLDAFTPDIAAGTLTYAASYNLNNGFAKTNNAAMSGGKLHTYVSGALKSYSLSAGTEALIGTFVGQLGVLFGFDGNIFYSNGEVARKWSI